MLELAEVTAAVLVDPGLDGVPPSDRPLRDVRGEEPPFQRRRSLAVEHEEVQPFLRQVRERALGASEHGRLVPAPGVHVADAHALRIGERAAARG
jgi:hypothetical protein